RPRALFAQIAGEAVSRFPGNRKNNREFFRSGGDLALSASCRRQFLFGFQWAADDSRFCAEQGKLFAETGKLVRGNREILSVGIETDVPQIPNLVSPSNFSNRISPLNCAYAFIPQKCESVEYVIF